MKLTMHRNDNNNRSELNIVSSTVNGPYARARSLHVQSTAIMSKLYHDEFVFHSRDLVHGITAFVRSQRNTQRKCIVI